MDRAARERTEFSDDGNLTRLYAYEFLSGAWINLVLHVLVVPTAVAAALFVRRLTAMQAAELDN
jgi:hypothetical protein